MNYFHLKNFLKSYKKLLTNFFKSSKIVLQRLREQKKTKPEAEGVPKMKEKIKEFISLYKTFTSEKKFAIEEVQKIIEWLYLSKDMKIIDNDTFKECYDYAIDAWVDLEKR